MIYYVSSSSGSDANSGTNGLSPFLTIAKAQTVVSTPGDQVLLKCGDVFTEGINISASGTTGNPIIYGNYGTGAKPIVLGFARVTGWANTASNIWESAPISTAAGSLNLLLIGGTATPMGKYPQSGFLNFESHVSNTSVTDNDLTGTPNWTGAELILRKKRWSFDRSLITGHSTGTLTYTSQTDYTPDDGSGYFIQNDIRTLTYQNAWYFNPTTKKISIYSTTIPTNVLASAIENLVYASNKSFITFQDIVFKGSNGNAAQLQTGDTIKFLNCDFSFAGNNGVFAYGLSNLTVDSSCTFRDINNNGVLLYFNCPSPSIKNSTFERIGLNMGMATGVNYSSLTGITMTSESGGCPNATIQYNLFDEIGYIPISGGQEGGLIEGNVMMNFCLVKDDGGGIYPNSGTAESPLQIRKNIIRQGGTAPVGAVDPLNTYTWGIYIDDNVQHIKVYKNSVDEMPNSGIFCHNAHDLETHHNNLYNNGKAQMEFQHDVYDNIRNIVSYANVAAALAGQWVEKFFSNGNDLSQFGYLDGNYFYADSSVVSPFNTRSSVDAGTSQSFIDFKAATGLEKHSTLFRGNVIYHCNTTAESINFTLSDNYVDALGNLYNGSVLIPPYESVILFSSVTAEFTPLALCTISGVRQTLNGKLLIISLPPATGLAIGSAAIGSTFKIA